MSTTLLTPAPGSNRCCYTSYPARDQNVTSLNARNAEMIHQRSLCIAAVDIAAETIRANIVVANEIIVQQLIQPPTTAGIFTSPGTATVVSSGALQPYGANYGNVFVANPNNVGVTLNGTSDGAIVDRDGFYQVSANLSSVTVAAASNATWSISVNGTGTVYSIDTSQLSTSDTVARGSIGLRLQAGDVIGLAVTTAAAVAITVAGPVNLSIVRLGS